MDVHSVLKYVDNKDKDKGTTTLRFKQDVIDILMRGFEGNILEVGTNNGNTTAILAAIGETLNKRVYSFDNNPIFISKARILCEKMKLGCKIIQKNVYEEEWDMENIGCVFIDCVHTEACFKKDLSNTLKCTSAIKNPIILAHDYGLITANGDGIKQFLDNSREYNIVRFLGEHLNWNPLGSGKVIDWEGVQIQIGKEL